MTPDAVIAILFDSSHIYGSFWLGDHSFRREIEASCSKYGLDVVVDRIAVMLDPHHVIVADRPGAAKHAIRQPQKPHDVIISVDEAVRRIAHWIVRGQI